MEIVPKQTSEKNENNAKEKEKVILWLSELYYKDEAKNSLDKLHPSMYPDLTVEELYEELLKYNPRAEGRPTRQVSNVA